MTPQAFAIDFIRRWEGGLSLDKDDNGNFFNGQLIGSKYGVTGAALAQHRKVTSLTATDMANLTIEEAADIALEDYYYKPNLHLLTWSRPVASIFDFGWGAYPTQAIKCLQRMIDAPFVDGVITPNGQTVSKFNALLAEHGEEFVAGAWWTIRDTFYELVIEKNSVKAKYEKGWDNRSSYFTPGNGAGWWNRWQA
jgi:lysozyme family protein